MKGRDYLTVAEAAAALSVSARAIEYRLKHGLMKGERVHARLWLIPRREVERVQRQGGFPRGRHAPRRREPGEFTAE